MPHHAHATSYGGKSENPKGRGPRPGSGGRPTKSFKAFLANCAKSAKTQNAVVKALSDHKSPGFGSCLKLIAAYDDEKPAEKRELSGAVAVTVKFVREGKRNTAG